MIHLSHQITGSSAQSIAQHGKATSQVTAQSPANGISAAHAISAQEPAGKTNFSHLAVAPVKLSPADFSQVFNASASSAETASRAQSAASSYGKTALLGASNLTLTA